LLRLATSGVQALLRHAAAPPLQAPAQPQRQREAGGRLRGARLPIDTQALLAERTIHACCRRTIARLLRSNRQDPNHGWSDDMSFAKRPLIALTAALVALSPLAAEAQGRHGGSWGGHAAYGYRGPGPLFWGLGLGIGLSALYYNSYGPYGAYGPYDYPRVVVAPPPPVVVYNTPAPPAAPAVPDPVIYPRNNQSAAQIESDRQECNRWATTQPAAMADASVFQRATAACMDAHGYTLR
jgi:hypothetical protein